MLLQISDISQAGIIFALIIIMFIILISIQFTLSQILKELREIRKNVVYKDYLSDRYGKGREKDE